MDVAETSYEELWEFCRDKLEKSSLCKRLSVNSNTNIYGAGNSTTTPSTNSNNKNNIGAIANQGNQQSNASPNSNPYPGHFETPPNYLHYQGQYTYPFPNYPGHHNYYYPQQYRPRAPFQHFNRPRVPFNSRHNFGGQRNYRPRHFPHRFPRQKASPVPAPRSSASPASQSAAALEMNEPECDLEYFPNFH